MPVYKNQRRKTAEIVNPVRCAVYYRQSSDNQVGNESTAMQQEGLADWLVAGKGWEPENIYVIPDDAGISGTVPMSRRPGGRKLLDAIERRAISHVCVASVSRFTRDEWGIDATTFSKACYDANVRIITPMAEFDFRDPVMGSFHRDRFVREADYSADYIKHHIKGVVLPSRARKAERGEYVGGKVPLGYVLEVVATGKRHSHKLVPFPPYAEVVNQCFEALLRNRGNTLATMRDLERDNVTFPHYDNPEIQAAIPANCSLVVDGAVDNAESGGKGRKRWAVDGYRPTRDFLRYIARNTVYIGTYNNGAVAAENAHPGIVPEKLFWAVYDLMSPTLPNGEPNPRYTPQDTRWRRGIDAVDYPRPLVDRLVFAVDETGELRRMRCVYDAQARGYLFRLRSKDERRWLLSTNARHFEGWVVQMVQDRLDRTYAEKLIHAGKDVEKQAIAQHRQLQKELRRVQDEKANLVDSLSTISLAPLRADVERKYAAMLEREKQIEADLADAIKPAQRLDEIRRMKEKLDDLARYWSTLTRDQQRSAIEFFVQRIVVARNGDGFDVTLQWVDWDYSATLHCATKPGGWTESERQELLKVCETQDSQFEIAARFPYRTWGAIDRQYRALRPTSALKLGKHVLARNECFAERFPEELAKREAWRENTLDEWDEQQRIEEAEYWEKQNSKLIRRIGEVNEVDHEHELNGFKRYQLPNYYPLCVSPFNLVQLINTAKDNALPSLNLSQHTSLPTS